MDELNEIEDFYKIEVPQNVQQFFYELFVLSYVGWAQLHRKTLKKNF